MASKPLIIRDVQNETADLGSKLARSCSLIEMVSNDAGSYALVKAEAAAGGGEGQPLQGHSSRRQLPPKVSGPPLGAASTLGHRAKSTASAWEIHPLKIQKSLARRTNPNGDAILA